MNLKFSSFFFFKVLEEYPTPFQPQGNWDIWGYILEFNILFSALCSNKHGDSWFHGKYPSGSSEIPLSWEGTHICPLQLIYLLVLLLHCPCWNECGFPGLESQWHRETLNTGNTVRVASAERAVRLRETEGRLIVKSFETCWFQHLTISLSDCCGSRKGFDSLMAPGNVIAIQPWRKHPNAAWQLVPKAGRNPVGVSVPLGKFIIE